VATTQHPPAHAAGSILAFDFGTRRIGVAVGECATGLAHPLMTIAAERKDARFAAVAKLIDEWHPSLLVVGIPVHADGSEHAMTASARRFARQLEGRYGLTVVLADERYTTRSAASTLRDAGVSAKEQRGARDQVAAQLILQDYLERHRERT
jgi:putative pre-16S rRNA nuclease